MKKYIQQIIDLFVKGNYPTDTTRQVQQWLVDETHLAEKDQALRDLWNKAEEMGQPANFEQSFKRMKQNTGMLCQTSNSNTRQLWAWRTAAAILLTVSSISLYLIKEQYGYTEDLLESYVPTASLHELTLPDGTQVMLNAHSTLLYPSQFTGKTRSVYLVGEANFKIKPDKKHPFIVKACDLQVTALGTEFNINAYPDKNELLTTLLEGSVKVEFNELKDQVILKPNQQLTYNKKSRQHRLQHPEIEDVTAWQRGELVLDNMTMEEIIYELERKYPYTFVYSKNTLDDKTYRFRFPQKATINDVLQIICEVVGNIQYDIKDNKCFIKTR